MSRVLELDHSFIVPAPPERAWDALLDVERVAPCMPGATVDRFDGDVITGHLKLKVGPVSLAYQGTAAFIERDRTARVVVVKASGQETRGSGTASATVRASLEPEPSGGSTRVTMHTWLNVTGRPRQFGRGVMQEVSGKLVEKFAANLAQQLAPETEADASEADKTATAPSTADAVDQPAGSTETSRQARENQVDADEADKAAAKPSTSDAVNQPARPGRISKLAGKVAENIARQLVAKTEADTGEADKTADAPPISDVVDQPAGSAGIFMRGGPAGGRSVFISYRRQLSEALALLVSKDLTQHGFDTFVDLQNLDSGEFGRTILGQIEAREHFIVLLQPGSLDQVGEDGDWLRREIAHALAHGRNVVPVTASGFEFRRDLALPPDVAGLPSFNAVPIQPGYFDAAMERLRTRFLKMPSDPTARP
jgi:carbon monoxide dehydrogenase subunit G